MAIRPLPARSAALPSIDDGVEAQAPTRGPASSSSLLAVPAPPPPARAATRPGGTLRSILLPYIKAAKRPARRLRSSRSSSALHVCCAASASSSSSSSLLLPLLLVLVATLLLQTSEAASPALKQDLFSQELGELDSLLRLAEERRGLVEALKEQAAGPATRPGAFQDRDRGKADSLLASLSSIRATSSSSLAGSAAAQDSMTEWAVRSLPSNGVLSTWLPGPPREGAPSTIELPEALLVVILESGQAQVLSPSGVVLKTFNLGHVAPVALVASVPWTSPILFATAEANGVVRIHKVKVRVRTMQEMSQDSMVAPAANESHLLGLSMDSALDISVSLLSSFEVAGSPLGPGKTSRSSGSPTSLLTALSFTATPEGSRFLVAGDKDGKVSAFQLDGNFASRLDATTMPGTKVSHLFASQKRLLFVAGDEWGFVDFDNEVVKLVDCENFEPTPPLRMGAFDASDRPTRVHLLDSAGVVWFLLARGARTCSVLRRSSISTAGSPVQALSVAAFREYLLLLARPAPAGEGGSSLSGGSAPFLSALNFTSVQLEDPRNTPRSLPVIFRKDLSLPGDAPSVEPLMSSWRARPPAPQGDENPPARERDLVAVVHGRQVAIYSLQVGVHLDQEEESIWMNVWVVLPTIVIGVSSLFLWHYVTYGRAWKLAINGGPSKGAEPNLGSLGGLG